MPWKPSDAKKHIEGLSPTQEKAWAKIANRALADCLEEGKSNKFCEGRAIRIASSQVKEVKGGEVLKKLVFLTDVIKLAENKNEGWAHVLIEGEFVQADKKFVISSDDIKSAYNNFKTGVRPIPPYKIPVDYNHGSGISDDPEAAKKAGEVQDMKIENDGLWCLIEWTDKAAEYIRAKEYNHISPEFTYHYKEKEKGEDKGFTLLAVGLVTRPFLEELQPVRLSEIIQSNETKEVLSLKEELIKLLKLDEKADEKAIVEKITALLESDTKLSEIKSALELKEDEDIMAKIKALTETEQEDNTEKEEVKEENKQLSERVTSAEKEVKQLREKILNKEADEFYTKLLHEGKVIAKQKDEVITMFKADAKSVVKLYENASQVIDFSERGADGEGRPEEDNPSEELNIKTKEIMKKENIAYDKAFVMAKEQNPKLVKAIDRLLLKEGE